MLSTEIDPVLAVVNAAAALNFETYVNDFVPNQIALRTLLSDAGILPIFFGAYEAYHGELYHATKVSTGLSLVAAAQILIDKWSDTQHLGAGASVLLTFIATDIYHIVFLGTP
jgi:hypothetical protein